MNQPIENGLDEAVQLGPVQNKRQHEKVAALVEAAKARGEVLVGGEPGERLFYGPTIIAGLDNGDPLVDEEQFGPALPVIRVASVEEAVGKANASPFGLGGSVWSGDVAAARAIAPRIECGTVWVNKHGALQPNAPFGGIKSSGLGVEFAEEGLAEYTDLQVLIS